MSSRRPGVKRRRGDAPPSRLGLPIPRHPPPPIPPRTVSLGVTVPRSLACLMFGEGRRSFLLSLRTEDLVNGSVSQYDETKNDGCDDLISKRPRLAVNLVQEEDDEEEERNVEDYVGTPEDESDPEQVSAVAQSYPQSPPSQGLSEVDVIDRVVREIRDELAPKQPSSPPSPLPPPITSQLGKENVELIDRLVDEIQSEIQQCVREKKERKYERMGRQREVVGSGEVGGGDEDNNYADNILAKLNFCADDDNYPLNSANPSSNLYANAEYEAEQSAQVYMFDYGDEDNDDFKSRAGRVAEQRTQIAEASASACEHLTRNNLKNNDDHTESEDEKVPYDGRVLKEGQYVRAKVNLRSRNKQDPFWGGVAKVTERKGRKQYYIYDGNRVTLRHISHLKNYDIGEKLLEDVKVNPTVWERAMPCLGPRPKFDVEYGNNKVRVNDDWRMKIVYLGYPGLRNMERVAMKIKDGKYQLLYLAVPDLPFEHWYKVLGDLDAEGWYGHEPKDEAPRPVNTLRATTLKTTTTIPRVVVRATPPPSHVEHVSTSIKAIPTAPQNPGVSEVGRQAKFQGDVFAPTKQLVKKSKVIPMVHKLGAPWDQSVPSSISKIVKESREGTQSRPLGRSIPRCPQGSFANTQGGVRGCASVSSPVANPFHIAATIPAATRKSKRNTRCRSKNSRSEVGTDDFANQEMPSPISVSIETREMPTPVDSSQQMYHQSLMATSASLTSMSSSSKPTISSSSSSQSSPSSSRSSSPLTSTQLHATITGSSYSRNNPVHQHTHSFSSTQQPLALRPHTRNTDYLYPISPSFPTTNPLYSHSKSTRDLSVQAHRSGSSQGLPRESGVGTSSRPVGPSSSSGGGGDGGHLHNDFTDRIGEEESTRRAYTRLTTTSSNRNEKKDTKIWELAGSGCCSGDKVWGGYLGGQQHCKQLCIDTPPCQYATHGWSGMGSSWCDLFEHCSPTLENCRGDNAADVETFHMLKKEGIGQPVLGSGGYHTSGHGNFGRSLMVPGTNKNVGEVIQLHSLNAVASAGASVAVSILFADFFTGVFHWAVDNYGNKDTPVFGAVIEAFQENENSERCSCVGVHHEKPWTLTYRPFATNAFAISLSVIPLLVVATALGPVANGAMEYGESAAGGAGILGPNWELGVVVFANAQVLSQEFHKYTHMKSIPKAVKHLQDCGVMLPRMMHQNHHKSPYGDNYCILTGQMNPLLDSTNFFRRLEKIVYTCTGNEPKCWQLSAEMKQGVLRGDR
eukprot:jgi/Bigna1/86460/estExt_fgenesh1_pg.C_100297